ncbi:MAG: cytochrome c biogenesis CcdA family protein [Saccharofermentanales bacterium]
MSYLIAFLEGIITFISPCLLPMLPVYISYFAGQGGTASRSRALRNSLGFVLGFTLVFITLGAFAGALGSLLRQYSTAVNLITGIIVILFGLHYLDVIRLPWLSAAKGNENQRLPTSFFAAVLFGLVFSISWTPCVGVFLGSALALAAAEGGRLQGIIMLLFYSLGLGIPFVISAVLINRMQTTIEFIKSRYHLITRISGGMLVIVGLLMATGLMNRFLSLLTF